MGRQVAAVVIAIRHAESYRETKTAGLEPLAQDVLHLLELLLGDLVIRITRRVVAEHPRAQRRVRHQRGGVDAEAAAIETVEIFGEGHPVPAHPGLHARERNRLGTLHTPHRSLTILGLDRREAEAAIANRDRGNAMPSGKRGIRVPFGPTT